MLEEQPPKADLLTPATRAGQEADKISDAYTAQNMARFATRDSALANAIGERIESVATRLMCRVDRLEEAVKDLEARLGL